MTWRVVVRRDGFREGGGPVPKHDPHWRETPKLAGTRGKIMHWHNQKYVDLHALHQRVFKTYNQILVEPVVWMKTHWTAGCLSCVNCERFSIYIIYPPELSWVWDTQLKSTFHLVKRSDRWSCSLIGFICLVTHCQLWENFPALWIFLIRLRYGYLS